MLIGEYNHTIDAKGRLNFPAKMREVFVVTRGLDHCLNVYSLMEWTKLEQNIGELPRNKRRDIERFFFSGAVEVVPDRQGRIVISANLREYAKLDKNIVVVGASDHAEIWDEAVWKQEFDKLSPESVAKIMDELDF